MKFLWTGDLKMNTVHVRDVCAATWHLCQKGVLGEVYNLADKNDTNQQKINNNLQILFRIQCDFVGTVGSNMAKLNFKSTVDAVNEKHCQPWSEMCKAAGINNTPLSPFLDQELLSNNPLAVDGTKIESTGFKYAQPTVCTFYLSVSKLISLFQMTPVLVKEVVDGFIHQGLFPQPKDYPKPAPLPPVSFK